MQDADPHSRKMGFLRVLMINVKLTALCLFCLFVILEVGARIWLYRYAPQPEFLHYASLRQLEASDAINKQGFYQWTPHRYLGYIPAPNFVDGPNRHNSLGFRGPEIEIPKPAGQYRIACLGASTTYTSSVKDYRFSYPVLLETYLRDAGYDVRTINAGAVSWFSHETLINFELRVLDLQPDMIIFYEGINDIASRMVWPPENYRGDNSGLRPPLVSERFMPNILEYSTFARILMIRAGVTQPHFHIERTHDYVNPLSHFVEWRNQYRQKIYPDGIFKEIPARTMLETNRPIYFRRNLENMLAIARFRKITPVLATFAYSPYFPDEVWSSSDVIAWAYTESNQLVKDVAMQNNANFFDFQAVFPKDKKYYDDGIHVNEEGAQLMARRFADYLMENRLIPDSYRIGLSNAAMAPATGR